MSDLGIICALFGYLLRLSDDADIMLGYNMACPLRVHPSVSCYVDVGLLYLEFRALKI